MNLFQSLKLTWLSDEKIKKLSFGAISNFGMLDTRTLKPKIGGFMCPRIFGMPNNFECYCGKYKGKKFTNMICPGDPSKKCGVAVTDKNVQRWRMSHIELCIPVVNILFFKNLSNMIGKILEINANDLEDIIYYRSYIILENNNLKSIKKNQIIKREITPKLLIDIFSEIIDNVDNKTDSDLINDKDKIKIIKKPNTSLDTDTDSDTDSEISEVDSNPDINSDSETDSETDSEIGTEDEIDLDSIDSDSGSDSGSDSESDSGIDSDIDSISDASEKDEDKEIDSDTDFIDSDTDSSDTDSGRGTDSDADDIDSKNYNKVIKKTRQLLKVLKDWSLGIMFFYEKFVSFLRKHWKITIAIGSEAFLTLLKTINVDEELQTLEKIKNNKTHQKKYRFLTYIKRNDIDLTMLVKRNIVVIPAGLRPMVKLKKEEMVNGKDILATTQLNTFYKKIKLADENVDRYINSYETPFFFDLIVNGAKRRLQKSYDNLLLGSISQKQGKTEIKGLLQQLSGKEGILRHYSLGKRTDFSARAVVAPSSDLRMDQIHIPVQMALVVFKPLIIRNLLDKKITFTVKEAEELIVKEFTQIPNPENAKSIIIHELNEICSEHLILFNRAPSLHRLSLQAAYPKLTLNKTIGLHPLVTTALNADFDGDNLGILPLLTQEEIHEGKEYLLTIKQIVDPKNGSVIAVPKQDMVLGIYYLTKEVRTDNIIFYDKLNDLWKDYELKKIKVYNSVILPAYLLGKNLTKSNKFIITTIGKIIFNQTLPDNFIIFINDLKEYNNSGNNYNLDLFLSEEWDNKWKENGNKSGWNKADIIYLLNEIVKTISDQEMANFLDNLKEIGFDYANRSGISISPFELGDVMNHDIKQNFLNKSRESIATIEDYYDQGLYSNDEYKQKVKDVWENCKDDLQSIVVNNIRKQTNSSFFQIWDSGARISSPNLGQLFAMRGYVRDYLGNTIDTPIISSLWEGLNNFETLILNYGMRKGMIDTALRTAETGYLTRRLIEAVQETIVKEKDCGTRDSITLEEKNPEALIPLIYSRFVAEDVKDLNGKIIISEGKILETNECVLLTNNNITKLKVYSVLTCESLMGVCQKCYGTDLSKNYTPISLGTTVGIIAAQSIGEIGTQLALRTFHSGGVDVGDDIIQGLPGIQQILDNITHINPAPAIIAKVSGKIISVDETTIKQENKDDGEKNGIITYFYFNKSNILASENKFFNKGDRLTKGPMDLNEYLNAVGRLTCQQYIVRVIKQAYADQAVNIHRKHFEIFARGMLSRVQIIKPGDNKEYVAGDTVNYYVIQSTNKELAKNNQSLIEFKPIISSLKDLASSSSSFLASASFQSPLKSLIQYSIYKPLDLLNNPKASLISGQIPPIGTGFAEIEKYKAIYKANLKNT